MINTTKLTVSLVWKFVSHYYWYSKKNKYNDLTLSNNKIINYKVIITWCRKVKLSGL